MDELTQKYFADVEKILNNVLNIARDQMLGKYLQIENAPDVTIIFDYMDKCRQVMDSFKAYQANQKN